ncbi:MAG: hypothetical protein QXG78_04620 [Candidatus Methanomethyliaceae archaeon]
MVESFSARRQSESLYDYDKDIVSELLEKEEVRKFLSQLEDETRKELLAGLKNVRAKINKYLDEIGGEIHNFHSYIGWKIVERGSISIDEALNMLNQRINDYRSKLTEKRNMRLSLENELKKEIDELSKQLGEVKEEKSEWIQSALTLYNIVTQQGLKSLEDREWAQNENRYLLQRYEEIKKKEKEICNKLYSSLTNIAWQKAEERGLEENLYEFIMLRDYLQELKEKQIDKLTGREWGRIALYLGTYEIGKGLGKRVKNSSSSSSREETYGRGKRNYLLLIIVGLASSLATLHFVDFSMKGMFLIQPHVSIAYLILSSILLATLLYLIFKKK